MKENSQVCCSEIEIEIHRKHNRISHRFQNASQGNLSKIVTRSAAVSVIKPLQLMQRWALEPSLDPRAWDTVKEARRFLNFTSSVSEFPTLSNSMMWRFSAFNMRLLSASVLDSAFEVQCSTLKALRKWLQSLHHISRNILTKNHAFQHCSESLHNIFVQWRLFVSSGDGHLSIASLQFWIYDWDLLHFLSESHSEHFWATAIRSANIITHMKKYI